MPSLGMVPMICQRQTRLKVVGGVTQSIFRQTERLLSQSSELQQLLFSLLELEEDLEYRSVVDAIFCELFPEWKISCRIFYSSGQNPLRDLVNQQQLRLYDAVTHEILRSLQSFSVDDHEVSFSEFIEELKQVFGLEEQLQAADECLQVI